MVLREYHQDRFQPGELSCIEKECFFAGLHDRSKYLVSHMKEEERADQEVILRTNQLARQDKKFRNLRTEVWRQAQQMDPVIPHVLEWLRLPKNDRTRLKDFL